MAVDHRVDFRAPDSFELSKELSSLLEMVLAGEVIADRAIAERLVRFLGAAITLHERHEIDRYGRCARCPAPWRPWRRPRLCSVYSTLAFCVTQPFEFVLPAVAATSKRPS